MVRHQPTNQPTSLIISGRPIPRTHNQPQNQPHHTTPHHPRAAMSEWSWLDVFVQRTMTIWTRMASKMAPHIVCKGMLIFSSASVRAGYLCVDDDDAASRSTPCACTWCPLCLWFGRLPCVLSLGDGFLLWLPLLAGWLACVHDGAVLPPAQNVCTHACT